jgi:Pilus formation protein N terminal region
VWAFCLAEFIMRRFQGATGRAVLAALLVSAALVLDTSAFADSVQQVRVPLDQARIAKLPEKVATIVVGNPLIADVAIEKGGILVITGKGFGTTNVVALDSKGQHLFEQQVTVGSPEDKTVIVHRGGSRETFSCAPTCERRITLGDATEYFDQNLNQAATRNAKASGR